jgi:hypothetical protein
MSIGLLVDNGTRMPSGEVFGYDTKIKDIYEDWSLADSYMSDHLDVLDLLCKRALFRLRSLSLLIRSHAKRSTSARLLVHVSIESYIGSQPADRG